MTTARILQITPTASTFRGLLLVTLGCTAVALQLTADPGNWSHVVLDPLEGHLASVDINGDRRPELVRLRSGDEALTLFSYGTNGFTKHVVLADGNFPCDRMRDADIDGDGDADIVAAMDNLEKEKTYTVVWLENPRPGGDPFAPGSWKIHTVGTQDQYTKDIVVIDLDRDGRPDIVTRAKKETSIYFQNTGGTWEAPRRLANEFGEGMDSGDLDGDGDTDLVLNGFWFETPADPRTGDFVKHVFDPLWFKPVDQSWRDGNASVRVLDLNGDSRPEIMIAHSELPGYPISIYSASTAAAVRADQWQQTRVAESFDYCQTLDAGDVDGDGDFDLLVAKFEREHRTPKWTNSPPYPVVVYLNQDGCGTKWKPDTLTETGMYAGMLADVDADGKLDVVGSRTYWAGPVEVFLNALKPRLPLPSGH